eukprot:4062870-Prymnesium_polylepis.1
MGSSHGLSSHGLITHGVARAHLAHVSDAEEEQRRVERDGAVLLARRVDHHLRLGRLLRLGLDLVRGDLGRRERVDQALVGQDVALRLGEQLEDGRLNLLELRRRLGVGGHELVLELLQVGALLGDRDACTGQWMETPLSAHRSVHTGQRTQHVNGTPRGRADSAGPLTEQLVLEALLRDREVEQRHLDGRLGRVVRVGQLGRQVKLELGMVRDGVVADLHHDVAALLERLLEQHRLERRVEVLEHVLHEEGLAEAHRVLDRAEELLVGRLANLDALGRLHVLDPLVGLPLRVDEERPAECRREDDAVLGREAIGGQPVHLPRAQLDGVAHRLDQRRALRVRHVVLLHRFAPLGRALVAVARDERAEVRHVARRQADVAHQVALLHRQPRHRLGPPDLLATEPAQQPARAVILDGRLLDLVRELLLLRDGRVKLGLERRDLVGHLLELRAQLVQARREL